MKEYQSQIIKLNSDRALIHRVKKAGIITYHPQGDFNGYGYEQLPLVAEINSESDMCKFNQIKEELETERKEKPVKPKRKKTQDEIISSYAKRLVKLYNAAIDKDDDLGEKDRLTQEKAEEIARKKLAYKEEKINEMYARESERGYSRRREILINKMERENPLRRIKDETHAIKVVNAHIRHSSGYDNCLFTAHELEENGKILTGSARSYALKMYYEKKEDQPWN